MRVTANRKTPGVYVTEFDAFPPSVVGVETAIPAFIGYTEMAEISGKPVFNKPIKITSMVDFESYFGTGYRPEYNIKALEDIPAVGGIEAITISDQIAKGMYDFSVSEPKTTDPTDPAAPELHYYNLVQTDASQFNLYNSMRLFYANGGGTCYIVSVGKYASGEAIDKDMLLGGLTAIGDQVGPTMLVIPDAVLLPATPSEDKWVSADFQAVTRAMLAQCHDLQDRVSILDVYGSQLADKMNLDTIIDRFRLDVGDSFLNYGMGYFPFLDTTVVPVGDFNYTNIADIAAGTPPNLTDILTWQNTNLNNDGIVVATPAEGSKRYQAVQSDIAKMSTVTEGEELTKTNQNLTAALPLLGDILNVMVTKNDVLPPSGAMAGVFTAVDANSGVWNAPANVTLNAVQKPTYKLTNTEQGDLNVPINGKAVDAIREFTGRGSVVWGARTLDGNSNDWRYIQVRRTLIYIEQSIKNAMDPYVFAANDGNTWTKVIAMVSSFLQGLWSQGGLMGNSASEAFTVQCGLGSTMTGQDILEGYMVVQVTVQMIRPAEFIELTFKQTMEGVG
ncbi:MAG: phage tail sheath protein FI [Paraglaciecola sp.]|jgi:phage tail sheath protein FI